MIKGQEKPAAWPNERTLARGRIFFLTMAVLSIAADLGSLSLHVLTETPISLVRLLITPTLLVALWCTWRGSQIAHSLLVVGMLAGLWMAMLLAWTMPIVAGAGTAFFFILLVLILLRDVHAFVAYRRTHRGNKKSAR